MTQQDQSKSLRNRLHQEQQGPASLEVEGPGAGYSLKDLGQPIHAQNAEATMPKQKSQTK